MLWAPSPDQESAAPDRRLREEANSRYSLDLASYADLHHWSVTEPMDFWALAWDSCIASAHRGRTIMVPGPIDQVRFFPDALLNVTEELLGAGEPSKVAVLAISEEGVVTRLTRAELRDQVECAATALMAEGVTAGDRVVAWAPNRPEVLIYALAALRIGAVVSTASPDFAPSAVLERFGQIEPKVLLGVESYEYGGRRFDVANRLTEIVEGLPSVTAVVVLDSTDGPWMSWSAWCTKVGDLPPAPLFPFDQPGFILFSSGTTGAPKCIVHSAAGALLKIKVEQIYNIGLTVDDVLLYFTTTGWMMWNWSLYALATGAAVALYDGSPIRTGLDHLLHVAQDANVTVLGVSAKLIDSWRVSGTKGPIEGRRSSLRMMLSTGSPLSPESEEYAVGSCIPRGASLVNMSGGTEICGTLIAGIPSQPIYRGEIQGPTLGMATQVFGPDGSLAAPGETGELVCTAAFPSMPLGFWGDHDGSKYREAYFSAHPGVWTHGDFATRTGTGGFSISGRSDATLNARGVRIGTAEIYRVVDQCPGVAESMAVTQDWQCDSRIVLFVRMTEGEVLDDLLRSDICERLRTEASPRHVPDVILQTPELPRTHSNKPVELTVADILNGRSVRNAAALSNPDCLEWFMNLDPATFPSHPR